MTPIGTARYVNPRCCKVRKVPSRDAGAGSKFEPGTYQAAGRLAKKLAYIPPLFIYIKRKPICFPGLEYGKANVFEFLEAVLYHVRSVER